MIASASIHGGLVVHIGDVVGSTGNSSEEGDENKLVEHDETFFSN